MTTTEYIPPDLQAAIESERHGTGPLSASEVVEMNELEICRQERGRLGMLNTARLEWLRERNRSRPAWRCGCGWYCTCREVIL